MRNHIFFYISNPLENNRYGRTPRMDRSAFQKVHGIKCDLEDLAYHVSLSLWALSGAQKKH